MNILELGMKFFYLDHVIFVTNAKILNFRVAGGGSVIKKKTLGFQLLVTSLFS